VQLAGTYNVALVLTQEEPTLSFAIDGSVRWDASLMNVHRRWSVVIVLGIVITLLAMNIAFHFDDRDSSPAILLGLHSDEGMGRRGRCPESTEPQDLEDALGNVSSRESTNRLTEKFPTGTAEIKLMEALTDIGFEMLGPCSAVPSIRFAIYEERVMDDRRFRIIFETAQPARGSPSFRLAHRVRFGPPLAAADLPS